MSKVIGGAEVVLDDMNPHIRNTIAFDNESACILNCLIAVCHDQPSNLRHIRIVDAIVFWLSEYTEMVFQNALFNERRSINSMSISTAYRSFSVLPTVIKELGEGNILRLSKISGTCEKLVAFTFWCAQAGLDVLKAYKYVQNIESKDSKNTSGNCRRSILVMLLYNKSFVLG